MIASRRSVLTASGILAATTIVALGITTVAGGTPATATTVGGCTATVRVDSQWGSGASGGQMLSPSPSANTSSSTASRWMVTWPLADGQRIVSSWNASIGAAGGTATATNTSDNGVLTSGASTTFGVQLAGPTSRSTPGCATRPAPRPPPARRAGPTSRSGEADNQRTVTLFVDAGRGPLCRPTTCLRSHGHRGRTHPRLDQRRLPDRELPLLATLRAVTPGTAELTTRTDHACRHATPPCALPTAGLDTVRMARSFHLPPTDAGQTVVEPTAPDNQRDHLRCASVTRSW